MSDLCQDFLTPWDWSQIYHYLHDVAQCVLIEKDYHDKDYRDTFSHFYSKKFALYSPRAIRLNFFNTRIAPRGLWDLTRYQEKYIGSMVIRPTRTNTIGRTLINPALLGFVHGFLAQTRYKNHLLGSPLAIDAFPYISQDTDVTVCAHAACWMIFRYFSERYVAYAEIHPYELTQLTHDLSLGRRVPSTGLTVFQVSEIFTRFGFFPLIYFRETYRNDPALFNRLLYYYVESGLPVVAGLRGKSHAITILGHSCPRSAAAIAGGNPINTYDLVDGFIVNDDNHLPYQVLWKSGPTGLVPHESEFKIADIDTFVVPVYEKIYLAAEHIESYVFHILCPNNGFNTENFGFEPPDLVFRIFLTSSRSYKKYRKDHPIGNEVSRVYQQIPMPKFIWVCEMTTKVLYDDRTLGAKKGQVLGEIIWDATASQQDPFGFIAIHFPRRFIVNDRDTSSLKPHRFVMDKRLHDSRPYDIYVNNLRECP